ncbi:MAG: hypothetical protein GWO20_03830 [Candidatus Korarchaeota archaeon]|nr:hypothetical protein [Candidatus Korarchaeota archaeon]NIU82543.1 hypothetical protein [Candidatus Thorarchaeota archaeon]NIW13031.1 hypothetical protein [Candidatus Thorarchaeota archaeon]
MSMTDFKKNIIEILSQTVEAGAEGVVVVSPSGFPVLSYGAIDESDREAATVFSVSLTNLSLDEEFSNNLSFLLGKKATIGTPWISGLGFRYGGSFYIGAYVRGYSLLAVLEKVEKVSSVRAALMRSVGSIVTLFGEIAM